jgi:hypothetical protein
MIIRAKTIRDITQMSRPLPGENYHKANKCDNCRKKENCKILEKMEEIPEGLLCAYYDPEKIYWDKDRCYGF